tara:strand:- start:49850 stop:52021 length:2172 start_codon:yes stop_codon:yes gene_type:complete
MGFVSVSFPLLSSCIGEEGMAMAPRVSYEGELPGSIRKASQVNAWLQVLEDGRVRVLSGKVELGQGIRTAIRQVAAEELDMDLDLVEVVLAETGLTPDEGYTAGSNSIPSSAMSVRYAAATARQRLLEMANVKLNLPIENLVLYNGKVKTRDGERVLTFSEILEGAQIEMEVTSPVPVKSRDSHKYVGKAIPRADIEKMVTGKHIYIQDLRFPGMVHARIVRPPNYQSKLLQVDQSGLINNVSGVLKTVVNGSFIGVIAEREYQAIRAEKYLRQHASWTYPAALPDGKDLFKTIETIADEPVTVRNEGDISIVSDTKTIKTRYTKPYIKHGSMGPACSVAMFDGEILNIWSHSQGIYPMRRAIAAMLDMSEDHVHVISVPGAGCYGHSTADDASADAALLAMAFPRKHVRVQWSRADENMWEPYGSAIIMEIEAGLDPSGKINRWKADVWTDSHSTRPNNDAGTLLSSRYLENPKPMKGRGYLGGGHRNADPYYSIPNMQVNAHFFEGPLRVSSLRSLGAYATIFATESMMDQLAEKSGTDSLEFRLAHLNDDRAKATIQKVKEMTSKERVSTGEGIGYAFCRYKNNAAYATVAAKVFVDQNSGDVKLIKLWAAVDVGEIINLDGIKNQIEGGMIQAASWTRKEQVTFNASGITSTDWATYPILRFSETPDIEVTMIDRPEQPAEGGGEVSMPPTGAAIANAVYRACGKRICDLPITMEKLKF